MVERRIEMRKVGGEEGSVMDEGEEEGGKRGWWWWGRRG